ncbi:response regulator [Actinoplanes regularis]|nr:response regulator [Actinoplanes regularis]
MPDQSADRAEHGHGCGGNRPMKTVVTVSLFLVGYVVLQQIGLWLVVSAVELAVFWPVLGFAMAVLARVPVRMWPVYVGLLSVATLVGNILNGNTVPGSVIYALANALQVVGGAVLVRRARANGEECGFGTTSWITRALLPAALLPPAAAALVATTTVMIDSGVAASAGLFWWLWFSSGALGVLAMLPVVEACSGIGWQHRWSALRLVEGLLVVVVEAALLVKVFAAEGDGPYQTWQWPFVLLPAVLWAAVRFGLRFTTVFAAALTTAVVGGTAGGYGPFAQQASMNDRMLSVQGFCVVMFLSSQVIAHAIATRETAERTLRERSEAMSLAVEGIAFIDPQGRYVRVNPAYAASLGNIPEQLVGQSWESTVHPDDVPALRAAYETMLREGKATVTARGVRRDGTIFFQEITMITQSDADGRPTGHHCFVRDITQRQSAEQRVSQFFALSQDLLCMLGSDGYFKRVNPAWTETLGYTEHELLSRTYTDFIHPDDREATLAQLAKTVSNAATNPLFDNRYRCKDGSYRWLRWTSSIDEVDKMLYGVARDVTEAKETERAMALARDQALETARMKTQFVATMSHEIRTPMNGVIGLADLLERTTLTEKQRRYVDGIRTAGSGLLDIINDILDYSKIESGKIVLEESDFDLARLIGDTAALLGDSARRKNLYLNVEVDPALPSGLHGDPGRLRQILLNLIGNAIKFTERGGVTVRAEAVAQPAGVAPGQFMLAMSVRDTGIGMDKATQSRIFEPFRQADASTTRVYGGTGLGLAITRQLAHAMGGDVTVDSGPGLGATFTVTVLLTTAAGDTAHVDPLARSALRILVVDDNEINQFILNDNLEQWGMRSESVSSAHEALALLRDEAANGRRFDLAIIDMHMPMMDGLQLSMAISQHAEIPATPIILFTSGDQITKDEAARAGIRASLTKPVDHSTLLDTLIGITGSPQSISAPLDKHGAGRILLVEDNDINQIVAADLLDQLGYDVDIAADGIEAIAKATENDYNAILMDCQMPRMDGYTATAGLRAQASTAAIPIIAMTADAFEEGRERCIAAGMNDYLSKPIHADELERTLTRWVHDEGAGEPESPLPHDRHPGSTSTSTSTSTSASVESRASGKRSSN